MSAEQKFVFPRDTVVQPGQTVRVVSGRDADSHQSTSGEIVWTHRFVWNNKGDCAVLRSPGQGQVSLLRVAPVSAADEASVLDNDDVSPPADVEAEADSLEGGDLGVELEKITLPDEWAPQADPLLSALWHCRVVARRTASVPRLLTS